MADTGQYVLRCSSVEGSGVTRGTVMLQQLPPMYGQPLGAHKPIVITQHFKISAVLQGC